MQLKNASKPTSLCHNSNFIALHSYASILQNFVEDLMKHLLYYFCAAIILLTLSSQESYAIPAFARKYKTSCATCHNGYPKLNAFGEAFRRSGYQFPDGGDAEFIREQPVELGSDGNKRAFPDAIWPGSIPGSSPIAFFLNSEIDYNPKFNAADDATAERFTFDGLGNSIEAVAGGTLGEDISFWGQLALGADGTLELNREFLIFSNLLGTDFAFNARVGVIAPGLFSFSTHRAWFEDYWFTTRPFSDGADWTLEETQKGIEFNGMLHGRFGYNVGIMEGAGAPHSAKDYYAHATYKFGGFPLDGVVENGQTQDVSHPYIDNSLTVGAFVYSGEMVLDNGGAPQPNNFTLMGGDYNAFYGRYNLFGGIQLRKDDSPFISMAGTSASSTIWFSELDVTVYPWLLPGLRYEVWAGQGLDGSGNVGSFTDSQIVPGVVFLVRPNLKITLRASFATINAETDANGNPAIVSGKSMQPGQVQLAMALGI